MGWTEYWKHHHPLRLWEWKLKLNFHLFWTTHSHTSTPEWFDCQWLRKKRHTLPYLEICRLEKALCLFEVHPHCWLCWSYTTLPDFFGPAIITTTTRGRHLKMVVDMGVVVSWFHGQPVQPFFYWGKTDADILWWLVTLKTIHPPFCRRFFCNYS